MDRLLAVGVNTENLPEMLEILAKALGLSILIFLAGLLLWTIARHFLWRLRAAAARSMARRKKIRPDGQPYPPTGVGVCTRCQAAGHDLFHLPSGQCLCKDCYARIEGPNANNAARSRT